MRPETDKVLSVPVVYRVDQHIQNSQKSTASHRVVHGVACTVVQSWQMKSDPRTVDASCFGYFFQNTVESRV